MNRWSKTKHPSKRNSAQQYAVHFHRRDCSHRIYCFYSVHQRHPHTPTFYFLLLSLLLVLAYAIPPIRLLDRGFGELALAVHLAYVIPSIGFLLQARETTDCWPSSSSR